jgi:hypothetical protein
MFTQYGAFHFNRLVATNSMRGVLVSPEAYKPTFQSYLRSEVMLRQRGNLQDRNLLWQHVSVAL